MLLLVQTYAQVLEPQSYPRRVCDVSCCSRSLPNLHRLSRNEPSTCPTGGDRDQQYRKLSVIPKIATSFTDGSDDKITGIQLIISGLGPARILSVQLYVNEQLVSEAYDDDQWRKALAEIKATVAEPSGEKQHVRFKSFMTDVYLQAGAARLPRSSRANEDLSSDGSRGEHTRLE